MILNAGRITNFSNNHMAGRMKINNIEKSPLIWNNVNIAVCCMLNWRGQKMKLIL
jgi:hypothetical protein